ncbi:MULTISPECIES: ABC transporter ATP-binding protein [Pseudomonas]|uniref:ABC transporter ATP-binding protein n=1 Tax=Pseudomonas TaxID=286 RepID=UPI0037F99302
MIEHTQAKAPILCARGLVRGFRGFVAVNGVDLDIHEGSVHALIGPNGAGKTTLFNLLCGALPLSAGQIHFAGQDISTHGQEAVARAGLVRSFQISAVFGQLSVHENVRLALQRQAGLAHQFWRSSACLRQLDARTQAFLEAVGLGELAEAQASNLSYGRKRMLEIATTLALEPRLLLLDEPMAGMGHEDIEPVVELIRRVAAGRTVLMVEHNLSVVRDLCDTVSVLQRGELIAQGDYQSVSNDARVREAYIGTEEVA